LASPITGATAVTAAAETVEVGSGSAFSQMGLASMLGPAITPTLGASDGRPAAGKPVAAGTATNSNRAATDGKEEASRHNPRIVVTGVAVRIRQLAKLRDEGRLTDEEFTEHKNRLLAP
jgi:hypothetical protein